MAIAESLCCFVLNQLDLNPALTLVRGAAGRVSDHVSDQSRSLLDALERSNRKAWKSLEISLAGETLWSRLDRAEVKALRAQIRAFLDGVALPELTGKEEFRSRCVREIREALGKGVLLGNLVAGELAEKAGRFAAHADPAALLQAEKVALARLGREVQDAGFRNLGWLLAQPAHGEHSVVVVAARYFFRREVEGNEELFRGLQFVAVESLGETQKVGFRGLEEGLGKYADRLETVLEEAAAEMLAAVAAVHATAKATHDSVNTLAAEMRAQMAAVLARLDMGDKPVQPEHSMAVRTDRERELVKELLARVRAAPPEAQRQLAGDAGKLQVAVGEYAAAAASFATAASAAGTEPERAEAYHNSYRAKLEQKDYPGAVADLQRAVALDPVRFAPFPTDKYELKRVLGAGGFGVTFQCTHAMTGAAVAVKSLTDSHLDQDIGAVLREATALDRLKHRAIVGLRDCGYADHANKRRPYLVMEYFDGQTLQDHVEKRGPVPLAEVMPLARTLAEALAAAHGQNVLHRDVKPANVMVKRTPAGWDVRLIDFGLAMRSNMLADTASMNRGNTLVGSSIAGTIDYAAPEQLGKLPGVKAGPPADVYGFARTLCFALFGTAEPTIKHYKSVPDGIAELIGRCLSRDPGERPQSFAHVLNALTAPPPLPLPLPEAEEIPTATEASTPPARKPLPWGAPKPAARRARRDDDDDDRDRDRGYDDRPRGPRIPPIDTGTRLMHAGVAFFFGIFGAHKFLQGNGGAGVMRLLLNLTCFGLIANVVIGWAEALNYLTMSNELYTREYLINKKAWF